MFIGVEHVDLVKQEGYNLFLIVLEDSSEEACPRWRMPILLLGILINLVSSRRNGIFVCLSAHYCSYLRNFFPNDGAKVMMLKITFLDWLLILIIMTWINDQHLRITLAYPCCLHHKINLDLDPQNLLRMERLRHVTRTHYIRLMTQ